MTKFRDYLYLGAKAAQDCLSLLHDSIKQKEVTVSFASTRYMVYYR